MNGVLDRRRASPRCEATLNSVVPEVSQEHILKKRVELKTQALMMLGQELDQCRAQRDRYKLLAEQLQQDLDRQKEHDSKKVSNGLKRTGNMSDVNKMSTLEEDARMMDLLIEAREKNKCLRLQVDTLRLKLKESQEDIKALRSSRTTTPSPINLVTPALHQREELIEELEKLHVKCKQLKSDLQSVLDEKLELETERDAFKCKAHRLNHELAQALNATRPIDVDALINENRYLQERIQQLLEEKELAQQSVQKYKGMLENKKQKGVLKLGVKSSIGSVMTFKQVEQLLQQGPNLPPQKAAAALTELHSICTALLETLNDKNLALAHQRKTNKILAARICELDRSVESPTTKLLEGYSSAEVDTRCDSTSFTSDLSEERSDCREPESQCDESSFDPDTKNDHSDDSCADQSCSSKTNDKRYFDGSVKIEMSNIIGANGDIENETLNVTIDEEGVKIEQNSLASSDLNGKSEQSDECCVSRRVNRIPKASNCKEEDEEEKSYFTSFGLPANEIQQGSIDDFRRKVDLERSGLPEHLKVLVLKHIDMLKAKV
ncbi:hypothetical protein QAD02_000303 [Eretmocerus hayati]|uniref:Uncharacterized protein n=1 Tax=Eretmocerus hayati TaxID=131215 RepID=A0ACC2NDB3_9HYME|nr:hypothetical protein QAD02_000303 [Eretmocerus hayati]